MSPPFPSHSELRGRGRNSHSVIDRLLPAPNEKAALVGSLGTPSLINPYVTHADLVLAETRLATHDSELATMGAALAGHETEINALQAYPRLLPSQLAHETGGGVFNLWHPSFLDFTWDTGDITLRWLPTGMSAGNLFQVSGKPFGGYASLNGTDEYMVAASTTTQHHNMHPLHRNVQVIIGRMHDPATGGNQWIASKYDSGAALREWYLMMDHSSQVLYWYVGESNTYNGLLVAIAPGALVLDKWFMAVCTCGVGEKNALTLWQEGTTVASLTTTEAPDANATINGNTLARAVLGGADYNATVVGHCAMDLAVSFHKRIAFTASPWWLDLAQIKSLIHQVMPNFCAVT